MNLSKELAIRIRSIYFGGNWTGSNLKDNLDGLTWELALEKRNNFNSIASIIYHMNYYMHAVLRELKGKSLEAKDELSFNHPKINNQEDWKQFLKETWDIAKNLSNEVEQLQEKKLDEFFTNDKHGTFYRNIQGVIEHNHYHLGQINIIINLLSTDN